MIKMYLKGEQENWDLHLGCLAGAYRATPQESTGLTPNLLMLGREVRLAAEVVHSSVSVIGDPVTTYGQYVTDLCKQMQKAHCLARAHLGQHAVRQKEIYDSKFTIHKYSRGDIVWYLNEARLEGLSPKLQPAYLSPCLIVEKLNDLIFEIQLDKRKNKRVVHHNKLKPFEGQAFPKWIVAAKEMLISITK